MLAATLLLCCWSSEARAHTPEEVDAGAPDSESRADLGAADLAPQPPQYESVVTGELPATAASASTLRANELEQRVMSPSDVLRLVPGLLPVQHQGGGKAEQYFLRGFDADHGTDVALFVDGVPVNLPSHAHGQGFADLHWLLPELLDRIEVSKGPYDARFGDFATGGAIQLFTRAAMPSSSVALTLGGFPTRGCVRFARDCAVLAQQRLVAIAAPKLDGAASRLSAWFAVELARDRGPFDAPQGRDRYNVWGKIGYAFSRRLQLTLLLSAHESSWNSSGQIPSRAVASGELAHFGSEDPSEGGHSRRAMLSLSLRYEDARSSFTAQLYYVRSSLTLWNDFTFFLRDPLNGDLLEQDDARHVIGANVTYHLHRQVRTVSLRSTVGVQLRFDTPRVQLWSASSQHGLYRERLADYDEPGRFNLPSDATIEVLSLGAFAEIDVLWRRWLRTIAAARVDAFAFAVDDRREERGSSAPATSGARQRWLVSPKASVVVSPHRFVDLFFNFGMGFHSNDARIAVQNGVKTPEGEVVNVVPRLYGGEIGLRWNVWRYASLALVGWASYLENETVFVGDAAVFEPSGASRRFGFDLDVRAQPLRWLSLDLGLAQASTQSVATGAQRALAPRFYLTGGIAMAHDIGAHRVRGSVRVRYLGARPAFDTDSDEYKSAHLVAPDRVNAAAFFVVDLEGAYRFRWFELALRVQNVANTRWREAQVGNLSCTRAEVSNPLHANASMCGSALTARSGVADVHYTAGVPLLVQLQVKASF